MMLKEEEAKAVNSLRQNNSLDFGILMNYFARCHENARDEFEDADTNDDRLRAQGVSREFRKLKDIDKQAFAFIKNKEEQKKAIESYQNDDTDIL